MVLYLSIGFSSPARLTLYLILWLSIQQLQPDRMKESRKILELSKRLSTRATTSMGQIMQTLSKLPVSIVILATKTHKRMTHQSQQKILWLDFFTVNIFLRLTVKIPSLLRLTAKFLAVLRLMVSLPGLPGTTEFGILAITRVQPN